MCQAIVKPAGITIEKTVLQYAWDSNSDGAGFAVRHPDHTVNIYKGFFKFKHFWKAYQHHEHLDCLIHFRYATHGTNTVDNCHPFPIGENAAMIHNGILDKFLPRATDPRSDTRVLIDDHIVPAWKASGVSVTEFLTHPSVKAMIESVIDYNKLAALTPEGFIIFNEALGEIVNGVWYSAGLPTPPVLYPSWNTHRGRLSVSGYEDDAAWEQAWERWDDLEERDDLDEADELCTICQSNLPVCQLGDDALCEDCWNLFTKPERKVIA